MEREIDVELKQQRLLGEILAQEEVRFEVVEELFSSADSVNVKPEKRSMAVVDLRGKEVTVTQFFFDGGDLLDVETVEKVSEGNPIKTIRLYSADDSERLWSPVTTQRTVFTSI